MTISATARRLMLCLGLVAVLAGCEHLPADLKRADAAAKAGDHATAIRSWQTLSEYGYPEAKLKLAQAYIRGNGVEQNPAAAVPLLEEAVAKGNPAACVELGQLYEKGNGVEKNPNLAESLYLKAAAQKFPRGMMALGRFYDRQKQPERAQIYYKGAAALGVEAAAKKVAPAQ